MTLVALHADHNKADIITDTVSYTHSGSELGQVSKVDLFPHLDAAVITQGESLLGAYNVVAADDLTGRVPDLDAFLEDAPAMARHCWQATVTQLGRTPGDSTMFVVGYSPRQQGFVAYGMASDTDWEPWRITGLHVMPSPTSLRPSAVELARLAKTVNPADVETLKRRPVPAPPKSRQAWVELAQQARKRALMPVQGGWKVFVAGKVFHTHLSRGQARTSLVHTFDDSGQEFQTMVAGTLHPQGQLGACPCGSGVRYLDCCLRQYLDEDCPCGSPQSLRDCCALPVDDTAAVV